MTRVDDRKPGLALRVVKTHLEKEQAGQDPEEGGEQPRVGTAGGQGLHCQGTAWMVLGAPPTCDSPQLSQNRG